MSAVIRLDGVTCRLGGKEVVRDLSLEVPEGSIYAFLGPNGAGKTTTIKLIMGILRPSRGRIEVLGCESNQLGPREKGQIGYVSENQQLPMWMRVEEFLDYCRPFYPTWDEGFCQALLTQFNLPRRRKLKALSRGMLGKVALISSLSYRPSLLMLDEPFSGLDPLVRDEFIRGVLELIEQEKWTVFISSHDMGEVERLCDRVGIIAHGQLLVNDSVAALQDRVRGVTFLKDGFMPPLTGFPPGWMNVESSGRLIRFVHGNCDENKLAEEIRQVAPGAEGMEARRLGLREIFLAYARAHRMEETG
ncbi:MAG: hypothetical protein OHK005_12470 [Candidatus Methylacidiphilales bacterium]